MDDFYYWAISGIGKETAIGSLGVKVIMTCIHKKKTRAIAEEIRKSCVRRTTGL